MESIIKYAKDNLAKGYSIEQIKIQLIKHGHSKKDVDMILERVKEEHIYEIAKYINKEFKFGFKPNEIKNYLLAIGHPRSHIDEAIKRVLEAKTHILTKKKSEIKKEKLTRTKERIRKHWDKFKPWQKGGIITSAPVLVISLLSIIIMIFKTVSETGRINCYSLGRVITCSLFESMIFYALLMLAFIIVFCLPTFILGAIIFHFIWRIK